MDKTIWSIGKNFFDGGLLYFIIRSILILLIAFSIAKVLWKLFANAAKKDDQKEMTLRFTGRVVRAIIYSIAVFSVLGGIKPLSGLSSAVLGATSVMSVVVGLAAQESFGNFIAGFFLAMYHPFNVGDVIYLKDKDISGSVVGITFRHTVINTVENTRVIVPNSIMNSAIVENRISDEKGYKKIISFDIGYDSDIDRAEQLIYEAVLHTENVIDIRSEVEKKHGVLPFAIRLEAFDDSGIRLLFPLYTKDFSSSFQAASDVRKKLLKSFNENHIEIPYQKIEIIEKK